MQHSIDIVEYTINVAECDCGWYSKESSRPEAEALGREHIENYTKRPEWINQAAWKKMLEHGEILEADSLHYKPRRLVINLDE